MSTIIRYNPFREMAALQSAMDRMFDETWRGFSGGEINNLALDVHETDNGYTVIANLPGVNADNIHVNVHDGRLTISAEMEETKQVEEGRVLLQERHFGKLSRTVSLPQPVQVDHVEANFEGGVLTLELPKSPEAQPRQIPVRTKSN